LIKSKTCKTPGKSKKFIMDKIKNLQKHLENPRNSSWIRSKTWKNTWKIQEPHHG